MEFNAAIPLHSQPSFSEGSALASTRDSRNNSLLWKKVKQMAKSNDAMAQNLQKTVREISKQRRKPLGGFVPQDNPQTFYPFKIYKPDQSWLATTGWTFNASGIPISIAINPNIPTNLPTTINPNTDMWRIWAVREGLCGVRSNSSVSFSYQFWLPGFQGTTIGADFSVMLECASGGCDGIGVGGNTFGLPYDFNPNDYPVQKIVPLVLPATFTGTGYQGLALSIETGEDATRLRGKVFNEFTDYTTVFNTEGSFGGVPGYPSALVPIGVISTLGIGFYTPTAGNLKNLTAFNLQFGHIQNRYGMYQSNAANHNHAAGALAYFTTQNFRGNFLTDYGMSSAVYYPGDTVVVQKTLTIGGTPYYFQNLWLMTNIGFTSDPTTDPNWTLASGISTTSITSVTPNT